MSTQEVVGDISWKFIEKMFDWKIGGVSALLSMEDDRRLFHSPDFVFAGSTWYFELFPFGLTDLSQFVTLNLVRRDSGFPLTVCYTLGIRTASGVEEKRIVDATDTYDTNVKCWWGRTNFLPKSELKRRMSELAPNDTLTITCTLATGSQRSPVRDFTLLSEQMKQLFLDGQNYDMYFRVKDQTFPAHKNIVRARSPVFASLLKPDTDPNNREIISISDMKPEVFKEFLLYLYCGTIERLSFANVFSLYTLATSCKVARLKEHCVDFMIKSLTTKEVCEVILMAAEHLEPILLERATHFFIANVDEILDSDEWGRYLREHPVKANELYKICAKTVLRN